MLLSFSKSKAGYQQSGMGARTIVEVLTNIQHIPASARIQAQWRVTCWTVLRFELLDVLVKTGFVRDVPAGELKDSLAPKSMFQRLLAYCALTADKRSLPPSTTPI